jgi:hypothetical protein
LPCETGQGTFPTERWIKVDAELNQKALPITAFVPLESLRKKEDDEFVQVVVSFKNNGYSGLTFPGELLSVSNPVTVDSNWLWKVLKSQK